MIKMMFAWWVVMLAWISTPLIAGEKHNVQGEKENTIQWVSLTEAEKLMAKKPKKVLIDVYTNWCGWCKVMDKKTYEHPEVVQYINKHFYAIKIDAEQKTPIQFMGKSYDFVAENRVNDFAVQLLQGRMSYPSTVFMEENFQNPQPVPGFLDPSKMELIAKYLGENIHKTTTFQEYQSKFVPTWKTIEK